MKNSRQSTSALRAELTNKQKYYASLLKAGAGRQLLDQVSEEINSINAQLYHHRLKQCPV